MTHTPGPWHYVQGNAQNPCNACVYDSKGRRIHLSAAMNDDDKAIVRLIAAAPDLDAYRRYIEDNLERIARSEGWTPVGFAEFLGSEELRVFQLLQRRKNSS